MSAEVTTAFLVVRDKDGFFSALTDLTTDVALERPATIQDIKFACYELLEAITQNSVSNAVMAKLAEIGQSAPQTGEDSPVKEQ